MCAPTWYATVWHTRAFHALHFRRSSPSLSCRWFLFHISMSSSLFLSLAYFNLRVRDQFAWVTTPKESQNLVAIISNSKIHLSSGSSAGDRESFGQSYRANFIQTAVRVLDICVICRFGRFFAHRANLIIDNWRRWLRWDYAKISSGHVRPLR